MIDCQLPLRLVGDEVAQGHICFPLADHKVYDDEALEDNSPCRVSQAIL